MVVMALVTTFMTTPVVMYLYPEWYQKQTHALGDDGSSSDNRVNSIDEVDEKNSVKLSTVAAIGSERYSIVTMLNRIESVPSMMALIQLLKRDRIATSMEIHALRLLELTQRTSVVMKYKDLRETEKQDPVLNVLRTFANLIGIKSLQTHLDYCPTTDYIKTVSDYGAKIDADLILLPWINRYLVNSEAPSAALLDNTSGSDLEFVNQAFSVIQHCTIGLFVDGGFGQIQDGDSDLVPQIIVAYRQDCKDDQAALLFALRLQAYRKIDLTVIRKGAPQPDLIYATNESIQHFSQNQDINNLFISDDSSRKIKTNVVCQFVEEVNSRMITESLATPLNKHDLIIVGRRYNANSIEKEDAEYEHALGKLGFGTLKNGSRNTSVLIIQSASN